MGRSNRADRRASDRCEAALGWRGRASVFVWRLQRSVDARHAGCGDVPPVWNIETGANRLCGANRSSGAGTLRQDAVSHVRRLSRGEADHSLGCQPVDVGHSPRAIRPRGSEPGREARRRRSAIDSTGSPGRSPYCTASGHRRRDRALDPSPPVRRRARRHRFHRRPHERRRPPAPAGGGMDVLARGGGIGRARSSPAAACRRVRRGITSADSLRLGAGTQPQWWKRRDVDPRTAGNRREVRRARWRLFNEQLRRMEHHASHGSGPNPVHASST